MWVPEACVQVLLILYFLIFVIYLIWLCQVLVMACGIFSCGMWDLVPWPGSNLGPSLHWEPRVLAPDHQGSPQVLLLLKSFKYLFLKRCRTLLRCSLSKEIPCNFSWNVVIWYRTLKASCGCILLGLLGSCRLEKDSWGCSLFDIVANGLSLSPSS